MRFVLGSTSRIKMHALTLACKQANISDSMVAIKTASGVNEQPVGTEETLQGAYNRASAAKEKYPEDCAIGIENGIVQFGGTWIDLAVIVMITPTNAVLTVTSLGLPYAHDHVDEAREKGFETTTVADIYAEKCGCDPKDPHHEITLGAMSREQILTDALYALICMADLRSSRDSHKMISQK